MNNEGHDWLCLQALHEMHKILSQVEILGSPIMLGSSLISGLSTFLAEPAKARNPSEFARGVGTGSVTLIKMASFGILTFIGQVSRPASRAQSAIQMFLNRKHTHYVVIKTCSCQKALPDIAQGSGRCRDRQVNA